jgi:hypothetical protein
MLAVVAAAVVLGGCATRDDISRLERSVDTLDESVTALDRSVESLKKPVFVTAWPECKAVGQEKKIDLNIIFESTESCYEPIKIVSDNNGCTNKTLDNFACICRPNATNEKVTWQAVEWDTKQEKLKKISVSYRLYFAPFNYLESDSSGKIKDKTASTITPLGPYKYSVVSEGCELDPHIIIGQ